MSGSCPVRGAGGTLASVMTSDVMAGSATDQSARPITRGGAWPWLGLAALVLGYFATWSVQFSVPQEALVEGGQVLLSALNT